MRKKNFFPTELLFPHQLSEYSADR